jgi:hypothetical protein
MHKTVALLLLVAIPLAALAAEPAAGAARRRLVALPKGLPAEIVVELLKEVATAEHSFSVGAAQVKLSQSPRNVVGFTVPTEVSLSGSDHLPWGDIRMAMTVRCQCAVLYDLSRVTIDRDFLLLPEAQVTVAFADPPGERGSYRYQCDPLRSDALFWDRAALEALRLRLLDEAPPEARKQYLGDPHPRYEEEFAQLLRTQLEERARQRPGGFWGSLWRGRFSVPAVVACVVLVGLVIGLIVYLWRR